MTELPSNDALLRALTLCGDPLPAATLHKILLTESNDRARYREVIAFAKYVEETTTTNPNLAELVELQDAIWDALTGWRYIRQRHGDLPGVGWDRVEDKLAAAEITISAWNTRLSRPVGDDVVERVKALVLFHKSGGHEGDGSDENLTEIIAALSSIPVSTEPSVDAVERASKAYAEATGYYVDFHPGLSSASADKIRTGIRAALSALPTASEPRSRKWSLADVGITPMGTPQANIDRATKASGEVVQADRERAWPLAPQHYHDPNRETWDAGGFDSGELLQAFRAHRLAHSGVVAADREIAEKIAEEGVVVGCCGMDASNVREVIEAYRRLSGGGNVVELKAAATDAYYGWKYIREHHGDLYGVGWDRVQNALHAALSTTEPVELQTDREKGE